MNTASSEIALAIGLRKLFAAYSGPIARIFKSAMVFQDFGVGSDGSFIDVAAIATYLAGTTGARVLQYDQASGALLTQANHALRQLWTPPSGTARAAVTFDGTMSASLPAALTLGPNCSLFSVILHTSPSGVHLSNVSATWYQQGYIGASGNGIQQFTNNTPSTAQTAQEGVTPLRLEACVRNGASVVFTENTSQPALPLQNFSSTGSTGPLDTVGGPAGYQVIGAVSEIVCTYTTVDITRQSAFTAATMASYAL